MPKSILITQCLQNDFVAPISQYDSLPNQLHIGHEESSRLLGEDYNQGILMKLMGWAYGQVSQEFDLIHIRDWHNPEDEKQQAHLERFGPHCLQESKGAEFVFEKVRGESKDTIINASGLNDFVDTDLTSTLDKWKDEIEVHVGIIGVWTEAKISYLVYDLATRYPNFKIAICSALTASSTTHMHYIALDQLDKLLDVNVISSVAEFGTFLSGKTPNLNQTNLENGLIPEFSFSEEVETSSEDISLLGFLYRNSKSVAFEVLTGGFSGNIVMKANSVDIHGHEEVPTVIKIGERNSISGEKVAFEKVQDVLGNSAPSITGYMESAHRAGIKYRYASMFDERVRTFQSYYEKNYDREEIERFLDVVFRKQLGRFYKASSFEKINLLEYYWFKSDFSDSVLGKVNAIIGTACDELEEIEIGNQKVYNVAQFYIKELDYIDQDRLVHSHHMAYLHGDLNGANIIIDGQKNVWLIDFFHTHRGHILKDLIKLENDVVYIFMKINSEKMLNEAMKLVQTIIDVNDLLQPLPEMKFEDEELNRAYQTVAYLRQMYPALIDTDRNTIQLWIGLLRYSVHTLSFDECNSYQKQLALYSSGLLAKRIVHYAHSNAMLRIDYVQRMGTGLGMTILPGRKDRNRRLDEDLEVMKARKVDVIIALITQDELEHYGVPELLTDYEKAGFETKLIEIVDQGIPTLEEMRKLVNFVQDNIERQEKNVVVHCVGGVGRTGTLAACYLKQVYKLNSDEAIEEVRRDRSPRAVETRVQEEFVEGFTPS